MALEQEKKGLVPMGGEMRFEKPRMPEAAEASPEAPEEPEAAEREEEREETVPAKPPPTPVQAVARVMRAPKDRLTAEVEAVLSEGLEDLYRQLSPDERATFKKKGEETARTVQELMMEATVNVKKVFDAIRGWLKLLSDRANRFYLEQEAKIKTDKLLLLAEAEKRERANATP